MGASTPMAAVVMPIDGSVDSLHDLERKTRQQTLTSYLARLGGATHRYRANTPSGERNVEALMHADPGERRDGSPGSRTAGGQTRSWAQVNCCS